MLKEYRKIKEQLEKILDEKRMEHTEGVAYMATALAMRYGGDLKKAYCAGLLHDCAKCMDKKKQLALCEKYNITLSEFEIKNPSLIHAKLGAVLAKEKYNIIDMEVTEAIKYHTTGKPAMSLLEKIVFSADYMEPGRKEIPGLKEIRDIIFCDIDEAVYMILKNTIIYLENDTKEIDDISREAYSYYQEIHLRKEKEKQ